MRLVAVRLKEGDDLKKAIEAVVEEQKLSAATVISSAGSLHIAALRMAGALPEKQDIRVLNGPFEIVSLIGNLGPHRTHLHMSISSKEGKVIGGHLKEGSIVHTTVELVLAIDDGLTFGSKVDKSTGFEELDIQSN